MSGEMEIIIEMAKDNVLRGDSDINAINNARKQFDFALNEALNYELREAKIKKIASKMIKEEASKKKVSKSKNWDNVNNLRASKFVGNVHEKVLVNDILMIMNELGIITDYMELESYFDDCVKQMKQNSTQGYRIKIDKVKCLGYINDEVDRVMARKLYMQKIEKHRIDTNKKKLDSKIKKTNDAMIRSLNKNGINHPRTVELSQELDKLLNIGGVVRNGNKKCS